MASVRMDRVTKRFGRTTVLAEVSLDVRDGEFLVLLGPSGCGKTTLLRLVAGLEAADAGEIWVGDERVTTWPPHRRNIAMVFQHYALYPHLDAFENIAFPLRARGVARAEVVQRVRATAERLGLGEVLTRKPSQLSGGQRQRVAIARAIVREPQVFLMDEPLSNLDAQLRARLRTELSRLQRELGTTTIYVTHDQVEAMTMGDRIAVLRDGRLQQVGTPADLYQRPANTFVAGFLGAPAMNLVAAEYALRAGVPGLSLRGQGWLPLSRAYPTFSPEWPLTVGIRPEAVELASDRQAFAWGRVEAVEYSGFESVLVVTAQGSQAVQEWAVKVLGTAAVEVGDIVPLAVDPDHVHLFGGEHGVRLGTLAAPAEGLELALAVEGAQRPPVVAPSGPMPMQEVF
ncbi:MAG: ABC transporter ATP-binding protein [Firmicutes bacterium]|nr:ABC transporter ATP-binding protein [Alicyclobacillaceae bacterium]MCL6496302.1 ABC transporter ATP-binding protein [Bacillota bacterium]